MVARNCWLQIWKASWATVARGIVADLIVTRLHYSLYSLEICMAQPKKQKKRDKNSPPRRRGPPGWTTKEQYVHLTGEVPAFNAAQAEGNLAEFWPNMHVRFSRIWAQNPLTPKEIEEGIRMEDRIAAERKVNECNLCCPDEMAYRMNQKLKTWFYNNGTMLSATHGKKPLLNLQPKKEKSKKRLSLVQAYSKKYFPTMLKKIAEERYQEHLLEVEAGKTTKMKPLDHRNKVIREYWDDETEETKLEITEYREWLYTHGSSEDEDTNDEDGAEVGDEEDEGNEPAGKGKGKAAQLITTAEAKAQQYHL